MSILGALALIVILVIIAVLLRQGMTNKKRQKEGLNSEKEVMVIKRSTKSKAFVIILNSLLVVVFMVSAWCYRDVSQYAAKGGDPLGLLFLYVVSVPSLLVLALVLASSYCRRSRSTFLCSLIISPTGFLPIRLFSHFVFGLCMAKLTTPTITMVLFCRYLCRFQTLL